MSFFASEFIFDNISSDKYGLLITSLNESGGIMDNPLLTQSEFILEKAGQSAKYHQLGTSAQARLSFPLEFYSKTPIYAYDREQIASWLSGKGKLKQLRIIQDDMNSIYFNCYFSKIDWTNIRNVGYGFRAEIVCDAPFAWKNKITVRKINKSTGQIGSSFLYPNQTDLVIINSSTDYTPVIPNIHIKLGDNNNKVKVINKSNQNQWFEINGLQNGEEISISENLIIESISNPNKIIIDLFNGEFLELIQGRNEILITGQVKEVSIFFNPSKLIGG